MLQIDVNWLGERPLIRRPLGILGRVPTWAFRISHPRARNCSRRASWAPVKFPDGWIETLSHGTWTSAKAPLPADAATDSQTTILQSVACPAVGTCVAA